MSALPETHGPLLVRIDFSNDALWREVSAVCEAPWEGLSDYITSVDDRAFEGASWLSVRDAVPPSDTSGGTVVFIADEVTFASADHSVLVVDTLQFEGEQLEPFRCIPTEVCAIGINLSEANLDWADFADHADEDGVFRGFPAS